ncbi:hypothetical protein KFU94_67855 [Chloroflexi bacterium TSY]|nr:hypothetical protein [Chloroflexi bacterium TSY]
MDLDLWEGKLPNHPNLEFFVQAVDNGGNVAIHDNKGFYFSAQNTVASKQELYLPIILGSAQNR